MPNQTNSAEPAKKGDSKKKALIIILIVLVIIVVVLLVIWLSKKKSTDQEEINKNVNQVTNSSQEVTNSQAQVTNTSNTNAYQPSETHVHVVAATLDYSTAYSHKTGDELAYTHYNFDIDVDLSADKNMKSVQIVNLNVDKKKAKGEIKILPPKHIDEEDYLIDPYYGIDEDKKPDFDDLKSHSGDINFSILDYGVSDYYDKFGLTYGSANFRVLFYKAGSFDYQAALAEEGELDDYYALEYANLSAQDLTSTIYFDIEIEFADGEITSKYFKKDIDGSQILQGGWDYDFVLDSTEF